MIIWLPHNIEMIPSGERIAVRGFERMDRAPPVPKSRVRGDQRARFGSGGGVGDCFAGYDLARPLLEFDASLGFCQYLQQQVECKISDVPRTLIELKRRALLLFA